MRWLPVVVALALTSCSHGPRWGGLVAGPRAFHLEPAIRVLRMDNGMRVAVLRDPRTNLVGVDMRYTVGAADDPQGRAGLAHLVEHLLFEAPFDDRGATIGDRLGEVSLYANAWTTWDAIHFTTTAPAARVDDVLAVEAARLGVDCAAIDAKRFERERDVVLEEDALRDVSWARAAMVVMRAAFGMGHPYARRIGTREVADATQEDVCDYADHELGTNRAILVVTGNVDVEATLAAIAKHFDPIQRRGTRPRIAIAAARSGGAEEMRAPVAHPQVVITLPVAVWDGERETVELAMRYADRAVSRAVGTKGMVLSDLVGDGRATALAFTIGVRDAADLDDVEKQALRALERLEQDWWWALEVARSDRRHDLLGRYDTFWGRGAWIADYVQFGDGLTFTDDLERLDGVDSKALAAWSRRLTRDHLHVARVLPDEDEGDATAARDAVAVGAAQELVPAPRRSIPTRRRGRYPSTTRRPGSRSTTTCCPTACA
jgi:zinc protease